MKPFQEGQQIMFSESCLYPNLKHPHISSVREVISTSRQIFVVLDKEEICLDEYLENHQLSLNEKLTLVDQLLSAVEYLHDRNICHRDLKIDNVLLDSHLRVKLIDFGFARYSPDLISGKCGSYGYAAPEIFERAQYDGKKADIFSLGIIFFKMLGSENSELNSLIRTMLDKDPELRPDIHTIRQNCIFSDLSSIVVNPLFDEDLSLPLENIQEEFLSQISCFCDISIETLLEHLQSSDCNIFKLIYYLDQEKYFPVYPQGNRKTNRRSFSTPNQLRFQYDGEQSTVSTKVFEKSYAETLTKTKEFFLKSNYCVSMQSGGGLNAVLNSVHDDNRFYLKFDQTSSGGCELVISHPPEHNEMLLHLFQFLQ